MKKLYGTMFVAAIFSSATVFAQDAPAKKFFLGGTAGFTTTKQKSVVNTNPDPNTAPVYASGESTNNVYTIAPEFGFYIRPNTALGIKLGYSHSGGDNLSTYNSYNVSPFVRFIIPIGKGRFSVYNDLGVLAGYTESIESMSSGIVGDAKILNLGAFYEPGLQFRLKDNINLLATLGNLINYNYYNKKITSQTDRNVKNTTNSHNLGINSDFFAFNSFRLGINLLF